MMIDAKPVTVAWERLKSKPVTNKNAKTAKNRHLSRKLVTLVTPSDRFCFIAPRARRKGLYVKSCHYLSLLSLKPSRMTHTQGNSA